MNKVSLITTTGSTIHRRVAARTALDTALLPLLPLSEKAEALLTRQSKRNKGVAGVWT